jgi:hypothetical protein
MTPSIATKFQFVNININVNIKCLHKNVTETSNNRPKTKSLHCPQLDHYDADGLAGHKTWWTAQTTTRIFNIFIYETVFYG